MPKRITYKIMKALKIGKYGVFLVCILGTIFSLNFGLDMDNKLDFKALPPLTSDFYRRLSPIYIDNLDPENNWEVFILENPWVVGTGSREDPYILNNMFIDAKGGQSCVLIKNSDSVFQIINSVFFNASSRDFPTYFDPGQGIYLENVSHGHIINSIFYNNELFGIRAINSILIDIYHNSIYNSESTGIFFYNIRKSIIESNQIYDHSTGIYLVLSHYNSIITNNISLSRGEGIMLFRSNYSLISDNTISKATINIELLNSSHNSVEHNLLSQFTQSGIRLRWFSHHNTILRNTVLGSGSNILIGDSSKNTVLRFNNPSGYFRYEDIASNNKKDDKDDNNSEKNNENNAPPIPLLNILFIGLFLFAIITVIVIIIQLNVKHEYS